LKDIYSININSGLNIISNYTLIDGIKDEIILPFKHYIIENTKGLTNERFYQAVFNEYVLNNQDLPFKKGVSWSRTIQ